MADETIIIQYVVDANQAISDAERMRQVIEANKTAIRDMSTTAKASFKDIGESIIKSIKGFEFGKDNKKLEDMLGIGKDSLQNQSGFVRAQQEAISLVRRSIQELGQEQRKQDTESSKVNRDSKSQMVAAQREYERVTKQGYGVMSSAAQAYGQQVQAIKQQIVTQSQSTGQTYNQVAQQMVNAGTSANVANSALRQLNTTGQQSQSIFSSLGNTLQYAFITILGMNAVNAVRALLSELTKMIETGQELAQSYFRLEAAVRSLRRVGLDVTTEDILNRFKRVNEETGNFYTQLELVKGAADFSNLIRNMKLTEDQVYSLIEIITKLSIRSGRSVDEVSKTIALFLSSGYTEGVQRLGVSINKVTLENEANRLGFKGSIQQLEEWQKAQAGYSLLLKDASISADDFAEAQNRMFGSIVKTKVEIENTKAALGEQLLPVWWVFLKAAQWLIDILSKMPLVMIIRGFVGLYNILSVLPKVWVAANKEANNFWGTVTKVFSFINEAMDAIAKNKSLGEILTKYMGFGGEEIELGNISIGGEGNEEAAEELRKTVDDLYKDIEQEKRKYNSDLAELERDLFRDWEEIDREYQRDLLDMQRDYERDRASIIEKGRRSELKAIDEYNRNVAQENRKYANDVAEANERYRNNELEAELEYQERLRKLREGFLYDLEDALHERDARQVLNLIRRYNLEKEQTRRQFDLDKEERARNFQLQLEELARQREERLRVLAEEQAARIAQIRAETQWELEERKRKLEQEKADRLIKLQEERDERLLKYQEELAELRIHFGERIKEIVARLYDEAVATGTGLQAIADEYAKVYGPNGMIDQYFQYYMGLLAAISKMPIPKWEGGGTYRPSSSKPAPTYSGQGTYMPKSTPASGSKVPTMPFANGGIMYANRPTQVTFGEKGMEKAEFTPISYKGKDVGKVVGSNVSGAESRNDTLALRILLSPELIAEMQQNTLDAAANILFEVQRKA